MPVHAQLALLKRNPSKRLNVGVAIDGSALSDKALQTACGLIQHERSDRLIILHVADSTKTFLPRHLQPRHLQNAYTSKAFDLRVTKAEWACREKGSSSTCEALMQLAQENSIDLLIVGSWGRKGEKLDMLGTVSDYSLREGHSSVAIVRATVQQRPPGQHVYVFATDGSRAAAVAFVITAHQLMRPGDKLLLACCSYDHQRPAGDAAAEFKEHLDMAAALKIPRELVPWRLERSQTVADGLLELVRVREADTLVCGISGYSQKKLGSVSDEITHHASCNTITIKDPFEQLAHQVNRSGVIGLSDMILPAKDLSRVSRGLERKSVEPGGGIMMTAHHHQRTNSHH